MEDKKISAIIRERQENKALCLFAIVYSSDELFSSVAHYAMQEVATMFKEELEIESQSIKNKLDLIETNFYVIQMLFALTDGAIKGDKESKRLGKIVSSIIDMKDIPKDIRKFVLTEIVMSSDKHKSVHKEVNIRSL